MERAFKRIVNEAIKKVATPLLAAMKQQKKTTVALKKEIIALKKTCRSLEKKAIQDDARIAKLTASETAESKPANVAQKTKKKADGRKGRKPTTFTGTEIAAIRSALKLTRKEFAKRSGASPATIYNWEIRGEEEFLVRNAKQRTALIRLKKMATL